MSQDEPSRLDRIEADLEAMRRSFEERTDRELQLLAELRTRQEIQQQNLEELRESFEERMNQEMQLLAELRTRQEIQQRGLEELRESARIGLERDILQNQNLELLANMVQSMIQAFGQHRSDGHGA